MTRANKPQSFVRTNEVLLKAESTWLHFANPHRVILAQKQDEVIPALLEIERLTQDNDWHAAGFVSYEAASAFDLALRTRASDAPPDENLPLRPIDGDFPLLWFGLYSAPEWISEIGDPHDNSTSRLNWKPTIDRETYNKAIEQIRSHIADGRTYQVNYTMRLQTDFTGSEWDFFLHLTQNQNKHAAYIDIGRYVICSASPELFFQLDGDRIICQPMKGTVKRGRTTLEDELQSQWLKSSEKNRAENVMIVDMIRNDVGRIAKLGSVEVPHLFDTERYSTLWQMTSTVTAKTSESLTEIFTALFPCASITGAPKVRTMKIITALESTPRKIYTGSIGYVAPNRKASFNVAIRTGLIDRESKQAEYGVGGGIVWDSTSGDEYEEALLKARVLTEQTPQFSLLETLLWTPDHGFFLRKKHVERMLDSANYFNFPILEKDIDRYLDKLSSTFDSPQRVRLLLHKTGELNSEAKSFHPVQHTSPLKVKLAREPIETDNIFLFHKTTHRKVYDMARQGCTDCDDVLLYNDRGELTEFTIGNLVVEFEGKLYTPPLSSGLLAGTFRSHLLDIGQISERSILAEELKVFTRIFMINSVRKFQGVGVDV
ncbi:MAG TPA: aminodeoxychorismate synthase component I [Anaerolineales bacterium]|nr:aminodeoxychorismate synthase component I [Anaerolineales bacterium]